MSRKWVHAAGMLAAVIMASCGSDTAPPPDADPGTQDAADVADSLAGGVPDWCAVLPACEDSMRDCPDYCTRHTATCCARDVPPDYQQGDAAFCVCPDVPEPGLDLPDVGDGPNPD